MEPHQNGGGLFPGDVAARGEGGDGGPVHQAQAVGHDNVSVVGLHVPEGQGHVLDQPGDAAIAQGADQHGGGLAPGDGVVGTEAAVLAGDGPLVIGGFHRASVPLLLRHVLINRPGGGGRLPAQAAAQHHHEFGPGHLLPHAEAPVGLGIEIPQGHAAVNVLFGPEILRHVGEGGCRNGQRAPQKGVQQKAGEGPFQSFHIVQLLIVWLGPPILTDFSPPVKRKLSKARPAEIFLAKLLT